MDQISGNISALSQQLQGFIAENRATMKPALDKLNGVLDHHRQPQGAGAEVDQDARHLCDGAGRVGGRRARSSSPTSPTCCPASSSQPFIDAAFSDLGLDPNVLTPSQRRRPADRPARHAGAAGAVPAHRSGRRAEPEPARRDHRQPGPAGVRSARHCPARPYRLLPLPRAAARAAARRPAARTARGRTARGSRPRRCRPCAPFAVPAPGQVPAVTQTRRARCPAPRPPRCGGRPMTVSRNDSTQPGRPGRRAGADPAGRRRRADALRRVRSTGPTSSRTSTTATASSSVTTCASSVCRSARSTRSNRSRSGPRSRSGTTASTRCPPTPRPRSCRRRW